MANTLYDPFDTFKQISKFGIGFDPFVKRLGEVQSLIENTLKSVPGYPPYNVVKTSDNHYVIEMAVAGFGKNSINIEMKDGVLSVTGKIDSEFSPETEMFLYKGIAERSFSRKFALADTVEIKNADLVNGMLKIYLENFIPENRKSKKIEIKD